jgi:RHS repeat-associated protein
MYDGAQKPTASAGNVYCIDNSKTVRVHQDFLYDNGQRLTDVSHGYSTDGGNVYNVSLLSRSEYNEKDQLIKKNIAQVNNKFLQGIDYTYNTRGWLTNINGVSMGSNITAATAPTSILTPMMKGGSSTILNLAITSFALDAMTQQMAGTTHTAFAPPPPVTADMNTDLFSENIYYSGTDSRFQANPQFNGNIQATAWQVAGRDAQGYGYTYDELDRLTEAKYFDLTTTGTGTSRTTAFSTDYKFNEKLTYDLRGNITTLKRNGFKASDFTDDKYAAAYYGKIDDLDYKYNDKNQVTRITDAAVDPNGKRGDKDMKGFVYDFAVGAADNDHYIYDANGNLIVDAHKGITNIEYNYLNLPQVITFTGSRSITFVYDASGAKLQKITNDNGKTMTYDYVNGVEYKNTILQRIAHTEGSISRQKDGAMMPEYVLRDHLGNTRVTFSDMDNDGIVTKDDIKQINHYSPFGLNLVGNWNGSSPDAKNKYQFGEKELQSDFALDWNDYGARFYDPSVARWWSVDPLVSKHPNMSPYVAMGNNPILFVDPDGRDYIAAINHKKKTITITAVYYTTGAKNIEVAKEGKAHWMAQNNKYQYVVGEGNKALSYKIKFNLKVIPKTDDSKVTKAMNSDKSGAANDFILLPLDGKWGETAGGNSITVDNSQAARDRKTSAHEMGHTLGHPGGNNHWNIGLMQSGSQKGQLALPSENSTITRGNIVQILNNAGIGLPNTSANYDLNDNPQGTDVMNGQTQTSTGEVIPVKAAAKARVTHQGAQPEEFNKGLVEEK